MKFVGLFIDVDNLPQVCWAVYDRPLDAFRLPSKGETHESFVSNQVSYLILRPNPILPICLSNFPKDEIKVMEVPAKK